MRTDYRAGPDRRCKQAAHPAINHALEGLQVHGLLDGLEYCAMQGDAPNIVCTEALPRSSGVPDRL